MQIRCPHCCVGIEVLDDSSFADVSCQSCGSHFDLVGSEATVSYRGEQKSIAHFELIELLGVGGCGSVWKARDTQLQRLVAVKVPRKEQLDRQEAEWFLRDARAAAQLKHPHIVAVHEIGRDDDKIYIAMDYVDGANLAEWIQSRPLTPTESAELLVKLGHAAQHAHDQGVVHRDLKPGNVMMDRQGEPHIMDFGLAKRDQGQVTLTADGATLGTPAYMSPEQAAGRAHEADARSDVYALGVILYELLTGSRPFHGDHRMLLVQIMEDDPPPPRRLNSRVPRDLETICLKCLRKEPERRYASAQALSDDLRRWLDGDPILARPVGRIEKAWLWCRKRPALCGLATAIAGLLVVILVVFNLQANAKRQALLEAERRRVANLVATVMHSSGDSLRYAIRPLHDADQPMVLAELKEQYRANNSGHRTRLRRRVACALASFGDVREELILEVATSPADAENVIVALQRDPARALQWAAAYRRVHRQSANYKLVSRLATVSLHLGEPEPAIAMCRITADPTERTAFIQELSIWHGDLTALAKEVVRARDPALRSAFCQALGDTTAQRLALGRREAVASCEQQLADWFRNDPHGGVHSAAGFALRQWKSRLRSADGVIGSRGFSNAWFNIKIPALDEGEPGPGHWYVDRLGITMLELPPGAFDHVRTVEGETAKLVQKVTIPRGTFLSDCEISQGLFLEFLHDPELPESAKPKDWPDSNQRQDQQPLPAEWVSWTDALLFCNWLSKRHQLTPCYRLVEAGDTEQSAASTTGDGWTVDAEADGYRLPTQAEWEYACRSGTTTAYYFGDDAKELPPYAVFRGESAMPCGSKRPNAWGFFDMHGNVAEWCYGPDEAPVVRGGNWQSTAAQCTATASQVAPPERSRGYGFRVARSVRERPATDR